MAVAVSVTLARARAASDEASLLVLFDWARALVVSVTTERMSTFPLALTRDVPPTDTWAVAPEVTRAKSLDEVSLLLSAPLLAVNVELASRLVFCPARDVETMVTSAFALAVAPRAPAWAEEIVFEADSVRSPVAVRVERWTLILSPPVTLIVAAR